MQHYNVTCFEGKLRNVDVRWNRKMTLCPSLCVFDNFSKDCVINLSKPILTIRPRKKIIECLLHEMVHAYIFIKHNVDNREEHTVEFHAYTQKIRRITGVHVRNRHNYLEFTGNAVSVFEWQCEGKCRLLWGNKGLVKRSVQRCPSFSDLWWHRHQAECGGTFLELDNNNEVDKRQTGNHIRSQPNHATTTSRTNTRANGRSRTPSQALMVMWLNSCQ